MSSPGPQMVLLCGASGGETDALQQYSARMATALERLGAPARVEVLRYLDGARAPSGMGSVVQAADAVVLVQYNPFSYGRSGIALRFVLELETLRRDRPDLVIALMCHETVVLNPGLRWALIRQVHKWQLRRIIRAADTVHVSVEAWLPDLRDLGATAPGLLPVGSNLPDSRGRREQVRARLDATDRLVVATFSTGHPSHDEALARRCLDAALSAAPDALVLTLGAGRKPLLAPGSAELVPGLLPAEGVSDLLAATDILISPLVDGISTRRGTVMAALQHEVALAGTIGPATDDDLRTLVASQNHGASLPRVVAELALDEELRAARARAGRALYDQRYDWPVLAERVLRDALPAIH